VTTTRLYKVSLRSRANREIRKLDRQILARISESIDGLAADPRPAGCRKVKAKEGLWRIRVGDWRIGYEIDDGAREVTIITVGHRSEFYE
jgi:mRNA interferase RelE/StbE